MELYRENSPVKIDEYYLTILIKLELKLYESHDY